MTFDEIMLRASQELGIPIDLHKMAEGFAKAKVKVPPDIFQGIPDEQAVGLMKQMIMITLARQARMFDTDL